MRFGLEHIEDGIARKLEKKLSVPFGQFLGEDIQWVRQPTGTFLVAAGRPGKQGARKPEEDERISHVLHARREEVMARRLLIGLLLAILLGIGARFALDYFGFTLGSFWIGCGVTLGTFLIAIRWAYAASPKHDLRYEITLDELTAAFRYLELTPTEEAYRNLLLVIAERDPNQEGRRLVRRELVRIRAMFAYYRTLDDFGRKLSADARDEKSLKRVNIVKKHLRIACAEIGVCVNDLLIAPSPSAEALVSAVDSWLERIARETELVTRKRAASGPRGTAGAIAREDAPDAVLESDSEALTAQE